MTSPVIGERAGSPCGANALSGTPSRDRIASASPRTEAEGFMPEVIPTSRGSLYPGTQEERREERDEIRRVAAGAAACGAVVGRLWPGHRLQHDRDQDR